MTHNGISAVGAAADYQPNLVFGHWVARPDGWDVDKRLDKRRSAYAGFDHHPVKPVAFEKLRPIAGMVNQSVAATAERMLCTLAKSAGLTKW
jgi:hypothetical protein